MLFNVLSFAMSLEFDMAVEFFLCIQSCPHKMPRKIFSFGTVCSVQQN